mgnify:CR=1 FL=1
MNKQKSKKCLHKFCFYARINPNKRGMYMFWNNLFKKKNKIYNTDIVNNAYSKMPTYEELTTEEQEYVNKLKEEYLNFYDTEDNHINLDNELFNEIKMYQELALDIMYNDHFGNIVNSIIDSKKLVYYSHKITEINNTLKYKYIALNELRKDKKHLAKHMGLYVLGKRKINILKALDHQMNIINNMLIIANQKITDYCACAIANYPKNIDEPTEKELNDRYIEVEKDYKDLFNTSINLDDNMTNTDKITYMEIIIDKFVYENKDLIDKLKEQLDLIANSEIENMVVQINVIDNLKKIKMYYNIFNKYGKNKLTKEDFEDLYQIIFNACTYFLSSSYFNFSRYYNSITDNNEKEFYRSIIDSKLVLLKLKQSPIFKGNKQYSEDIVNILMTIFEKYDKDYWNLSNSSNISFFSNYFDNLPITEKIINFNLKLLLSLDYESGFNDYFADKKFIYVSYLKRNLVVKDFYKLLIGVNNYLSKNDITEEQLKNELLNISNRSNNDASIDSDTNKKETYTLLINIINDYKAYEQILKLYSSLYDIDFNIFPEHILSKHINILINYYDYGNGPLIINNNIDELDIKYSQKDDRILIINGNVETMNIQISSDLAKDDNVMHTKVLLPIKPLKMNFYNDKYEMDSDVSSSAKQYQVKYATINKGTGFMSYDYIKKIFAKIGAMFILREEILDYSESEMCTYFKKIFKPIIDIIDDEDSRLATLGYSRKMNFMNVWLELFSNMSILFQNGIIMYLDRSIIENYGISNNIGILSYVLTSYDEAINLFVNVLKKYKTDIIISEKRMINRK